MDATLNADKLPYTTICIKITWAQPRQLRKKKKRIMNVQKHPYGYPTSKW